MLFENYNSTENGYHLYIHKKTNPKLYEQMTAVYKKCKSADLLTHDKIGLQKNEDGYHIFPIWHKDTLAKTPGFRDNGTYDVDISFMKKTVGDVSFIQPIVNWSTVIVDNKTLLENFIL
jgi:hypothetical protein